MKRKYLNGSQWTSLGTYSFKYIHIDDIFCGYISLIKVDNVIQKITVDYEQSEVILMDDNYKWLMFLPDNEKWCVSAIYNESDEIIEWYFDMTVENSVDEQGNPYYDDLYLDIAVSPEFNISILDEDELKEALDAGEITKLDYDMAYETCDKIIKEVIPNEKFLVEFFNRYLVFLGKSE